MTFEMPPELMPPQSPEQGAAQAQPGIRDTLGPLATGPVEKFMTELMAVVDESGNLDAAFKPNSVEDDVLAAGPDTDPLATMNIQQITKLVDSFMAIPEDQRKKLYNDIARQLPPSTMRTIDAAIRLVQSNGGKA